MKKSSINNMDANVIILIAYLGGLVLRWIPGLCYFGWLLPFIIYILEKDNVFVKKHAIQATTLYLVSAIISLVINLFAILLLPTTILDYAYKTIGVTIIVAGIITFLTTLTGLFISIFSIISMAKTWSYADYDIPLITKLTPTVRRILESLTGDTKTNDKDIKPKEKPQKEKDKETPKKKTTSTTKKKKTESKEK